MIANIYAPNIRTLSFIKQALLDIKRKEGPDTIAVGYFNTSLSSTDRSPRQKINKLQS
jgi:hypothetical protein